MQYIIKIFVVAWPDNKEKCTELFDYCVTYLESEDKAPFVSKVPIDPGSDETEESKEDEESGESEAEVVAPISKPTKKLTSRRK